MRASGTAGSRGCHLSSSPVLTLSLNMLPACWHRFLAGRRESPSSPEVRTRYFHCRGHRSDALPENCASCEAQKRATRIYGPARGIQPILYNHYILNITFNSCEPLCCTPVTFKILHINFDKKKNSEFSKANSSNLVNYIHENPKF